MDDIAELAERLSPYLIDMIEQVTGDSVHVVSTLETSIWQQTPRLAASAAATDGTIQVNSLPVGVDNHELYALIGAYSDQCELRKVTSIAGNALQLNAALTYSHDSRMPVKFLDSPIANVKYWGAKGDESTDDTTALQRAAIQSSYFGATLHIPAGRYLTNLLKFHNDGSNGYQDHGRIHIMGDNPGFGNQASQDSIGTWLVHNDGRAENLLEFGNSLAAGDTVRNIIVENISLQGGDSTDAIVYFQNKGAGASTLRNFYILATSNATNGIVFEDTFDITLQDGRIFGNSAGTPTGIGVLFSDVAGAALQNQYVFTNVNIFQWDRGLVAGVSGTPNNDTGPIFWVGGQIANCINEAIYLGNGVRSFHITGTRIEKCDGPAIRMVDGARGLVMHALELGDCGRTNSQFNIEIGVGGTTEAASMVYGRGIHFFSCRRGIDIAINGDNVIDIDLDQMLFEPHTNGVGRAVRVEATNNFNARIYLGPQIQYIGGNSFAVNIDDANENISYPRISNRTLRLSGGETTPDVSGYIQNIRFGNASATTVTDFLNGVTNQLLYMTFENTNTTIAHDGTNISLKGAANYTPGSSDEILVLYRTKQPRWIEVSRTA